MDDSPPEKEKPVRHSRAERGLDQTKLQSEQGQKKQPSQEYQYPLFLPSVPIDEILQQRHDLLTLELKRAQLAGNDEVCRQIVRRMMPIRKSLRVAISPTGTS
jgi:hypothetical protein